MGMTLKEQIMKLQTYKMFEDEDTVYVERDDVLKVLEQQPCEDCISKEEVDTLVDELARAISDERCYMSRGRSTATIMQDLLNLSSVTPQQKSGEWKYVTHYARRYRVCSECNAEKEDDRATGWNFCPNCGADMRGDKNEME